MGSTNGGVEIERFEGAAFGSGGGGESGGENGEEVGGEGNVGSRVSCQVEEGADDVKVEGVGSAVGHQSVVVGLVCVMKGKRDHEGYYSLDSTQGNLNEGIDEWPEFTLLPSFCFCLGITSLG